MVERGRRGPMGAIFSDAFIRLRSRGSLKSGSDNEGVYCLGNDIFSICYERTGKNVAENNRIDYCDRRSAGFGIFRVIVLRLF